MANYLAIESATDVCSVALLQNAHTPAQQITFEASLSKPRAHSENLTLMIKDALDFASLAPSDLAGVAVSMGPGSYTGLRIGVSTAKGLAYAHNIPLIGIESLEALATATVPHAIPESTIGVAFNSRKNEVYLGLFTIDANLAISVLCPVSSLQKAEIAPFISEHVSTNVLTLAGEGAPFVAECLNEEEGEIPQYTIIPQHIVKPSAGVVATLGAARHKTGHTHDLERFEPFYLNEFIPRSRKKSIFERIPF